VGTVVDWITTTTTDTNTVPITFSEIKDMYIKRFSPEEETVNIGGDNCHLCGAEKKCSSGFTEYGKKCGFRGYIMYTCGTAVYSRRKGCNDRPKRVSVGDKCIKVSK
jgi:hypothetical protein